MEHLIVAIFGCGGIGCLLPFWFVLKLRAERNAEGESE